MIAALAIGAVTMSFKMVDTDTLWNYVGDANPGVFTDAANWDLGAAPSGTCFPNGSEPCEIEVDASDQTELNALLSTMNNAQVLQINPGSRKP